MDLDPIKLGRDPFVAGAAGAVVALKFAPGDTVWARIFNVAAGALCAGFFAPAAVDYFHVSAPAVQASFSFGIGMFGLSMAAAVVSAIRDIKLAEIASGWLRRKE